MTGIRSLARDCLAFYPEIMGRRTSADYDRIGNQA